MKNKFRTLTQGQNSDNVLGLMSKTFKALTELADWNASTPPPEVPPPLKVPDILHQAEPAKPLEDHHREASSRLKLRELHYNIQIFLPETRDVAVYDAIFESLKRHLL